MKYQIDVDPHPNNQFTAQLGKYQATIHIRQLDFGMFVDLRIGNNWLCASKLARHHANLLTKPGQPIPGKLYFEDTQGNDDANYAELGSRFRLVYDNG